MISHTKFQAAVREHQEGGGNTEFPLLALAIHLVITPLSEHPADKPLSESPWYRICKYHFGLYVALIEPSIETVQAGLLIALFEHVQCVENRAPITLNICATMMYALGVEDIIVPDPNREPGEITLEEEEIALTWWTMVLLDG